MAIDSESTSAGPLEFNPFLPEVRADPYPLYRRLRAEDPVHENFPGVWILTRYTDCLALIRDPTRFSSDSRNSELVQAFRASLGREPSVIEENAGRSMLFQDPPDHERLRNLVNKAFTAPVVERMRRHIQEIVDEVVDRMAASGRDVVDLVEEVAYPLPVQVICEMLGVPIEDRELFHQWSADLVLTLDPVIAVDVLERGDRAALGFADYFTRLLPDRQAHPREDLLTAMIQAEERGQRLTELELLSMCILLLVAGHETTVNLISNGMLSLLRHPDQLARLRGEPGLIRSAVEEMLRYDSPVQMLGRTVMQETDVGGRRVLKGHQVVAVLGAANRDPAQFPDPDRLDLARADNRHLAFGGGIHYCLGGLLARAEGHAAIGTLVRRFPDLRLAEQDPPRRQTITLRGLASLPVAIR
jgi:cytochrome P450